MVRGLGGIGYSMWILRWLRVAIRIETRRGQLHWVKVAIADMVELVQLLQMLLENCKMLSFKLLLGSFPLCNLVPANLWHRL